MNSITITYANASELKQKLTEHYNEFCGGPILKMADIVSDRILKAVTNETVEPQVEQTIQGASPLASQGSEVYNHALKVDLDSRGLPWDARIHQDSREKTQSGTWKYKKSKGVKELVPTVEAELRGGMGKSLPTSNAQIVTHVQSAQTQQSSHLNLQPFNAVNAQDNQAAHTQSTQVQQSSPNPFLSPLVQQQLQTSTNPFGNQPMAGVGYDHTFQTFKANLLVILSQSIKDGRITQDFVNQALAHFNTTSLVAIQNHDESCAKLFDIMVQQKFLNRVG